MRREREGARLRCPHCHRQFSVLADEADGQHPCPWCGYAPWHDGHDLPDDDIDDDDDDIQQED